MLIDTDDPRVRAQLLASMAASIHLSTSLCVDRSRAAVNRAWDRAVSDLAATQGGDRGRA